LNLAGVGIGPTFQLALRPKPHSDDEGRQHQDACELGDGRKFSSRLAASETGGNDLRYFVH
jgi:hypothetical protein